MEKLAVNMCEYKTRQKLQKLLTKLAREGRCWQEPFGEQSIVEVKVCAILLGAWFIDKDLKSSYHSLREIVSKESKLWQFVCKHHFVQGVNRWTLNAKQKSIYDKFITSEKEYRPYTDYQYWLIESSLVEEKDLAKFLLDNIRPGAQNQ